jgi:aminobenzoyl-glutamate transport protein
MDAAAAIASNELKSEENLYRILNRIERVGNAVPSPAVLFVALAFIVVIASAIVSGAELRCSIRRHSETIRAVNLLSVEGLHRF